MCRVVGDGVDGGDHFTGRHGMHGLTESPVALVPVLVVVVRVAVRSNLHPIDGESLRDAGDGIYRAQRSPVRRCI